MGGNNVFQNSNGMAPCKVANLTKMANLTKKKWLSHFMCTCRSRNAPLTLEDG